MNSKTKVTTETTIGKNSSPHHLDSGSNKVSLDVRREENDFNENQTDTSSNVIETIINDITFEHKSRNCETIEEWRKTKKIATIGTTRIMNLNIRSLRKYHRELTVITDQIKPDVLVLTETDLMDGEETSYPLIGYTMINVNRTKQKGGGVAIFFNEESVEGEIINLERTYCFELLVTYYETNNEKLLIVLIYNPPRISKNLFLQELDLLLQELQSKYTNENIILAGDINIDKLKENRISENYLTIMAQNQLIDCITDYTREAVKKGKLTKSCIDHIFVRNMKVIDSVVIKHKVADHYVTVAEVIGKKYQSNLGIVKQESVKENEHKLNNRRVKKEINKGLMKNKNIKKNGTT